MSGECLSVLVVVAVVFGNICFLEGTEDGNKLRRFLDANGSHCRDTCVHGSCLFETCRCNHDWTGRNCDEQIATTGACHYDHDCNTKIICDVGTKSVCYFGQMCACVTPHHHADRNLVDESRDIIYQSRDIDAFGNIVKRSRVVDVRSQCGPYHCAHGSCEYKSMNGVSTHNCFCYHGWHGELCDQPTGHHQTSLFGKDCSSYPCYHGHCVLAHNNHEYCQCHDGWAGYQCQTYVTATVPTTTTTATTTTITTKPDNRMGYDGECNYHGYWIVNGCECHEQWWGNACQNPPDSGHPDHCFNHCGEHGTCVQHHSYDRFFWNCKCNHGWHGPYCTQQYIPIDPSSPTTTTSATPILTTKQTTLPPASATSRAVVTMSTAPISTTSAPQTSTALTLSTCNHVNTLSAIAQQSPVSNKNAMECSPGNHTSHEALVLTDCSVPQNPSLWKQGANVMSGCTGSNAIPNYTPIAAFDHGQYSSIGSLSGVFLGCTADGFKVASQRCGQAPYIAELHLGGSNTLNPNMYYTIS